MTHIVLLGDSIFDNSSYTAGGPDVVSQVRQLLPEGWRATSLALDGATTQDIAFQLRRVPEDASHLMLSVGGNDALASSNILRAPADCTAQAISALADISQSFEQRYRRAVGACRETHLPLTLCTIYNCCFPDAIYQRLISTALMVFNDVILRVGIESETAMIDLRFICSSSTDYANPIEPSSIGGAKIARAIVNSVSSAHSKKSGARVAIR